MGWKNEKRDFVEIIFEFETIQEFHSIEIFCNNQFTRDISVFKELKAFFSIGGDIYNSDSVSHHPMTDEIFEEPRNITAKLHRRVGRFVKIQLYFGSKWLLISEVTFDSVAARGNYSSEVGEAGAGRQLSQDTRQLQLDTASAAAELPARNTEDTAATVTSHMPVIVGALATVIILLAAVIFFIVSRTRGRKLSSGDCGAALGLPSEKIALNCNDTLQFSYDPLTLGGPGTAASDSGNSNSNGSRGGGSRKAPYLDNNFNSSCQPQYGSPRSPRAAHGGSRAGSVHASPVIPRATPHSTPRVASTPQRRIINNPLVEGPLYMEPYQVMRYSPYVQYGTSGLALAKETAILSGERQDSMLTSPHNLTPQILQTPHSETTRCPWWGRGRGRGATRARRRTPAWTRARTTWCCRSEQFSFASLQSSFHCHCLNGKCQLSITKLSLRETYEEEEYNEELLLNLILFR